MTRTDIIKTHLISIVISFLMILDLAWNSIIVPFFMMFWAVITKDAGSKHSPYETMSARMGRGYLAGKRLPRVIGWPTDRVFGWFQKPIAELPDGRTFHHPSHCLRAFVKTKHGAYLPDAYHAPLPPEVEACYRNPT